ncbi:UDP-4-amino-4-deoxy-L-arabinose--oxoglutarate aminotransferase [Alkalibacterium sp. AK22]|uniref:DegT/DnrJ/EryC1/StrS family aminotransferase n=1 Tax=Alkalibacterium sp. AK22 TaxID=1229520 RepID=UPI000445127F|nr:DegT/DnrJ/EryC1/StrS family aminotransferase [Alkalibacterium sp. AK22]EXJ23326.1 UDP-4-amino-4-deoxy-L-arabinose--oxoglutarate aminotransferase [Alkalibacterium sp. AK22]
MNKIQVTQSSMPHFDDYVNEIKDLWDSKWLTNRGSKHQQLEKELIDYLNVSNISLYTNGHLGLENILDAFNLKGEVITTPFTFASTTHSIVRNGLKPVFCDINPLDYTIDVDKIESLITEDTCAIVPVHVYGNVCDVEKIEEIAKKHYLKVIYDAAHTFGVTVNGQGIGSFGDASMFSFHATKVFNTIEGGAVTFGDASLSSVLDQLKNFGITSPESIDYVGGNAKMNEFQAAMGICNLRYVDEEIAKRQKVVQRYRSNLEHEEGITLVKEQPGVKSNFAYFPVVFDHYKSTRDQIFEKLKEHDIIARKYFYPLINEFNCYKDDHDVKDTPVAKYIADRVLTLPLYADLSLADVDKICQIIKE